ncbi:hypothetical protein [Roseovarius phycicola]|uniref:Uncharacterized protein n=1 Tax=Roseovarius phycicola TaxID=3080976 RepID=A0ABZ2HGJ1_9RHOB
MPRLFLTGALACNDFIDICAQGAGYTRSEAILDDMALAPSQFDMVPSLVDCPGTQTAGQVIDCSEPTADRLIYFAQTAALEVDQRVVSGSEAIVFAVSPGQSGGTASEPDDLASGAFVPRLHRSHELLGPT